MPLTSDYGSIEIFPSHPETIDSNFSVKATEIPAHIQTHGNKVLKYIGLIIFISFSVSLFAVMSIGNWTKNDNSISESNLVKSKKDTSIPSQSISIVITNEYGKSTDLSLSYNWLEGASLIEPYKETLITIESPNEGCTYDFDFDFDFDVVGASDSFHEVNVWTKVLSTDTSITVSISSVGTYNLLTTEMCNSQAESIISSSSSSSTRTRTTQYTNTIYVKYVRRELRSLTDTDREDFLDALATLYDVSTVDGQKLYGSNYKSLYYFLAVHVDGAGNPVCDEFHSGPGFLSNHVFMSNYLEQSLQLVNPKVALHYMEYTKDFSSQGYADHLSNQLDGGSWSEIFSDKYFGSNDPFTGRLLDSRWKDSIVPYVTSQFYLDHGIDEDKTFFPAEEEEWLAISSAHLRSPYGLLRPPWHYNPNQYITRFQNEARIPSVQSSDITEFFIGTTCDDMYEYMIENVQNQDLNNFLTTLKLTHTMIHDGLGGQGGDLAVSIDDTLRSTYGFDDEDIIVVVGATSTFNKKYISSRNFYSSTKYPVYPLQCSDDPWDADQQIVSTMAGPGEESGPTCTCVDYYFENESNLNLLVQIFFDKLMRSSAPQYKTAAKVLNLDFNDRMEVMKLLCSRLPYDGDMVGSASAMDPIFWVSHGAVEKLFQRVAMKGLLTSMDYTVSNECSGHAPDGTKSWLQGYYFIDSSVKTYELSNAELSNIINPTTNSYRDYISYVYDGSSMNCDAVDNFFV